MAKTKISQYDSVSANNSDIDGINIAESCPPSGINNAIREVMAHLKDWQSGVSGDTLPVASGGTGSTTASGARTNLGLGTVSTLNSIATANIDADAVTNAKIADDSIDSEHYVDGSIDTAHLADDAVTSAKIATDAVGADALNVSGNGTSGQALLSDGDGTFSWGSSSSMTTTTGSAPYYGARAWVMFDGTGTASIESSANISSLTDNGTGDYTLSFTTAMPDTNYCLVYGASKYTQNQVHWANLYSTSSRATGSVRVSTNYIAGGGDTVTYRGDLEPIGVAIFR
jgi:hypothetical protein